MNSGLHCTEGSRNYCLISLAFFVKIWLHKIIISPNKMPFLSICIKLTSASNSSFSLVQLIITPRVLHASPMLNNHWAALQSLSLKFVTISLDFKVTQIKISWVLSLTAFLFCNLWQILQQILTVLLKKICWSWTFST